MVRVASSSRERRKRKTPDREGVEITGLLAWMNRGVEWNARGLQAFRFLLLLHASVRTWGWVAARLDNASDSGTAGVVAFAVAMSVAPALTLTGRFARAGVALAATLLTVELSSSFPGTPNHVFLEYVAVLACLLLEPTDKNEGRLLLSALRWVTAIVLFYTGFQKLLGGYYHNAEFFVWATSAHDSLASVFSWLLTTDELQRVLAFDGVSPGSGPYRTDSLAFLLASNAVWIVEVALGLLLVDRRGRGPAALAALAVVLMIQVGAREVMFALLFSQLLLLFFDGDWNRRTAPCFLFAYLYILAYLAGLVPGDFLVRGTRGL